MGRRKSYDLSHNSTEKARSADGSELVHSHQAHQNGISWVVAAIFIVGEMVGGGLVAMPGAMRDAGIYAGVLVTLVGAVTSGYTGIQLGDNWIMMQKRWDEYRSSCRKPYPEMARRAIGIRTMHFVSVCIVVTQFSISVVFLLLAAGNLSTLLISFFDLHISTCYLTICVAVAVLPLIMLGSPKDFWQAAVAAMVSTSIAIILILINTFHDSEKCYPEANYPDVQAKKFFLAYGTIIFAYGGHAAFPTLQHDMKEPKLFGRSVTLAYIIIVGMYLPVCIACFLVYGDSLQGNLIDSLQLSWIQKTVNVLITIHVFLTIVIIYSPLSQGVEEFVGVEQKWGVSRIAIRSGLMTLSTFVALSMPNFGVVLDLVGGSTITLMTMLLPPIFNLFLLAGEKKREILLERGAISTKDDDDVSANFFEVFKYNNAWLLICNAVVLFVGVAGGAAATYSAIDALSSTEYMAPCYVLVFQGNPLKGKEGSVALCGAYRNISTVL